MSQLCDMTIAPIALERSLFQHLEH